MEKGRFGWIDVSGIGHLIQEEIKGVGAFFLDPRPHVECSALPVTPNSCGAAPQEFSLGRNGLERLLEGLTVGIASTL